MTAVGRLTYAYGVVAAEQLPRKLLDSVRAIDDRHRARLVAARGVAAVASDVAPDEFGSDALPARLNDLPWLDEKARAHERVLEQVLAVTAVVPFRFCTVYRSDDELVGYLDGSAGRLRELLARLEGRVELGVKAFADEAVLEDTLRTDGGDESRRDGSGRDYLLRRGRDLEVAAERTRFLPACAAAAHELLAREAVDARLLRPQPRELSRRPETMFLNAAYLVDPEATALRSALGELEARFAGYGVSFELTGPWPAYNFVPADPSGP